MNAGMDFFVRQQIGHLALLLVAASCTHSGPPPASASASARPPLEARIEGLRKDALASRGAIEFVRAITEDVGARAAGSPSYDEAVAWAEKRLVAEGFTGVHRESVRVTHWERGPASAAIISSEKRVPLDLLALGGSGGTAKGGIDAEVVRVESLAAAQALGEKDLAGKILFLDVSTPRERDGSGYGRAVPARTHGPRVAAERGATGFIVRSISPDPSVPHTGSTLYDGIASIAVSGTSADLLRDALNRDPKAKVHLDVQVRNLPTVENYNVVGDIRGKERPDEIVLLGAHLDSWDVGRGAADDGAGCAIMTEAARLIAKYQPRRTVRVVLFAAEETTASGGKAYAQAHEADASRYVLAMEADTGEGRPYGLRAHVAPNRRPLVDRVVGFLSPLGIQALPGDEDSAGDDVDPLHDNGVPIFGIYQDMSRYYDIHHTERDVFEHIDQAALVEATAAYAVAAYAAAEFDDDLGRVTAAKSR